MKKKKMMVKQNNGLLMPNIFSNALFGFAWPYLSMTSKASPQ